MFEITGRDSNSRARTGVIYTSHGKIETPAYIIVGTNAEVRTLSSDNIKKTKTQVIIVNTYHLWRELGDKLQTFEGLHERMKWNGPIMTDSGGFQVFSLGFGREHGVGKMLGGEKKRGGENLARITKSGVFFTDGDDEHFLGPELSMEIQRKLGADIIFAFDECTSPEHNYAYQKEALQRTHQWAKICLSAKEKLFSNSRELENKERQMLFGIVQGGRFEDLRTESAKYIGSLPFDGIAIGGSFGKQEMLQALNWTIPFLPENKSRHLLGIGKIKDIFDSVERGVDTFDCVIPTREARHGSLWTASGRFDVRKSAYKGDKSVIQEKCYCPVCSSRLSRSELHNLFKSKNNLAGTYATIHNVFFFNDLMEKIRNSINGGCFQEFRDSFLRNLP